MILLLLTTVFDTVTATASYNNNKYEDFISRGH